ncbi:hypothetical protein ENSA5_69860 [Enhygromyxa salina]|uniref:Lipoprotein n=1 Tax=Enhygromyxa salina TaxID=215803 RepID=A0A2S9XAR0_9BACT|nr:hypothetical protein [Enhygromyxa salina]PRP89880.1 hypothetical protein ENSA5_69860 [Enhygromyxa salina]
MRTALVALTHACVLAAACAGSPSSESSRDPASDGAATDKGEGGASAEVETVGEHEQVGKELPSDLVAELRMQGADADGRLLTLAPGFIATAACSDCGAPSYLWFLAVRCADPRHCSVLTEQCEGEISRDADTYLLEFRAVEEGAEAGAEVCAGYSGTFESP